MISYAITKNCDAYPEEHNYYMEKLIRIYPGITIEHESNGLFIVNANKEAAGFLSHMIDCDMMEGELCYDIDED